MEVGNERRSWAIAVFAVIDLSPCPLPEGGEEDGLCRFCRCFEGGRWGTGRIMPLTVRGRGHAVFAANIGEMEWRVRGIADFAGVCVGASGGCSSPGSSWRLLAARKAGGPLEEA